MVALERDNLAITTAGFCDVSGKKPQCSKGRCGVFLAMLVTSFGLFGCGAEYDASALAQDLVAPSTPTDVTAIAVSASRIHVNWTDSTDNLAVTGYEVYRNGTLLVALGNVSTYQNTGLNPNTSYTYTVLAVDAAGNRSPQSAAATATTIAPDTTPPLAPTGLTATVVSGSRINLSWTASTDNVAVTGYKVYRDGVLQATTSHMTNYQDIGLASGTLYSYAVSAIDAVGNESPRSTSAIASTLTANASVTLEWDAVTDPRLRGYRVYYSSTNQSNYQAAGQGLDVDNVTEYTVTGLLAGTRYYFKATAYDTSNFESTYSNEIFTDIP